MGKFYLLGHNISYSLSPSLHRIIGEVTGKMYDYYLMSLEENDLDSFFDKRDFDGLNVTVPYKIYAAAKCDVLSPEARETGSVNTVVNREGMLYGFNTDIGGFLNASRRAGFDYSGKKVLVLGSGGASRAVSYGVKTTNPAEVTVISRKNPAPDNYESISAHYGCDYIINATPVGMTNYGTDSAPLSLKGFTNLKGVFDLIYSPPETKLLAEARQMNIPAVNGFPMLVAQGILAGEIFTGAEFTEKEKEKIAEMMK